MTYISTWIGFLYLAVVMDVFSRKVMSWSFGEHTTASLVISALKMAESFFANLKCELIDRHPWKNKAEARLAIFTWIESWYNPTCRYPGLGYLSLNNFENQGNCQL
jgi:putative transposase